MHHGNEGADTVQNGRRRTRPHVYQRGSADGSQQRQVTRHARPVPLPLRVKRGSLGLPQRKRRNHHQRLGCHHLSLVFMLLLGHDLVQEENVG
jgi:hypothetical protein